MRAPARRLASFILLVVFVAGCAASNLVEPISRLPQSDRGKRITHQSLAVIIAWSLWPDLAKSVRSGKLAVVWKPNGLNCWFEDEKTGARYGSVIVSNMHTKGDSVLCEAVARYRNTSECVLLAKRIVVGRDAGWDLQGLYVLDTSAADQCGIISSEAIQLSAFSDYSATFFPGSTDDTLYALVPYRPSSAKVVELVSRRVDNTIWWDILRCYRSVVLPRT